MSHYSSVMMSRVLATNRKLVYVLLLFISCVWWNPMSMYSIVVSGDVCMMTQLAGRKTQLLLILGGRLSTTGHECWCVCMCVLLVILVMSDCVCVCVCDDGDSDYLFWWAKLPNHFPQTQQKEWAQTWWPVMLCVWWQEVCDMCVWCVLPIQWPCMLLYMCVYIRWWYHTAICLSSIPYKYDSNDSIQ